MKKTAFYSLILCLVGLLATEKAFTQDLFTCELGVTLSATGTCDSTTGTITVDITGGFDQSYTIEYSNQYTRTFSGTITTSENFYTITGLSAARYTIIVLDNRSRCRVFEQVSVVSDYVQGKITVEGKPAACSGFGAIDVSIDGNEPPYAINLTGPVSGRYIANSNGFSIFNLTSGDYEVVIGQGDCIQTFSTTVGFGADLPNLTISPETDDCGIHLGAADFLIANGTAPYEVVLEGPTAATFNVDASFQTDGLVEGSYKATLTDADGCVSIAVLDLNTTSFSATISTIGENTSGRGFLKIGATGGISNYKATYDGPTVGSRMINSREIFVPVLAGTYDVTVTDAGGDGCSVTETVTVEAAESGARISGITTGNSIGADKVIVQQNYPNPFNGQTTIRFDLPQSEEMTITIQDHFGRVITQQQQTYTKGINEFIVNGTDLNAGMYFYTISTEGFSTTKRMIVQ